MSGQGGAVDFAHLETYVAGDRAIAREVLGLFSDQARTVLKTLNPAMPDEDWRNTAHSLKGSALSIGAFGLAEVCSQAEQARAEPEPIKRACLDKIVEGLSQVLTEIAAYSRS
jgi:HPt (histidine-containing phosphotransfer) domain-containing protein